ncbi:MAG: hypothetical protein RIT43_1375 [Bacteroidota bacterium]
MITQRISFFATVLLLLGTIFLNSCKKKCVIEKNILDKGWIEENVIIYPESGFLTDVMQGNYVVTGSSPYADRFQVSIDGGARQPVDYNNYTILGCPVKNKCNAEFIREVTINSANQTVLYEIDVKQCKNCPEVRRTENYVLVPKFPSSYQVTYDVSITEIE